MSAATTASGSLGCERIASLTALRSELQRMVEECACGRVSECRVIETLADSGHDHGRLQDQ
jgi:hypothetical protein